MIEPHSHDELQIVYANSGSMHVRTQGQPVSDIAFDLGYSSVSAFSYAFRKQTGHSPSAYAKLTTTHLRHM
ncbi:AraC family transcriptional regulator [Nitrincola sp. MINF-07-Sa-05]|uniref:AraC family transcriptional regulator n=1 Tax=Nitrincola salilacus TaxID=3400273 RepID=UPI003918509F